MTRLARCWSLIGLVLVSIVVAGLKSEPATAAQDTMFRVDYVKTRTVGATVVEQEEGTHTFTPTGHRRIDRAVGSVDLLGLTAEVPDHVPLVVPQQVEEGLPARQQDATSAQVRPYRPRQGLRRQVVKYSPCRLPGMC